MAEEEPKIGYAVKSARDVFQDIVRRSRLVVETWLSLEFAIDFVIEVSVSRQMRSTVLLDNLGIWPAR